MFRTSFRLQAALTPIFFLLMITFPGFSQQEQNHEAKQKVKIGFLVHDLVSERWNKDLDFFSTRIRELGGLPVTNNAYSDAKAQSEQLKELVDQGVKVVAIVPVNSKSLVDMVDYANRAGVKIIAYDRLIKDCNIDYYISYNSLKVGMLQAEYVLKLKPKGNYIFINGPSSDNNASLIKQGQMKVLKPYIDRGDIKVVMDQAASSWGPLEALMLMEDYMASPKNEKIDVVMASSDALSEGVVQAFSSNQKHGNPLITGQDASLSACKNMMAGYQTMSVYKSIKNIAYEAAAMAMKLANNEEVKTTSSINNGLKDVPGILFEPVVVDKSNLKEVVVNDGHVKESDL